MFSSCQVQRPVLVQDFAAIDSLMLMDQWINGCCPGKWGNQEGIKDTQGRQEEWVITSCVSCLIILFPWISLRVWIYIYIYMYKLYTYVYTYMYIRTCVHIWHRHIRISGCIWFLSTDIQDRINHQNTSIKKWMNACIYIYTYICERT